MGLLESAVVLLFVSLGERGQGEGSPNIHSIRVVEVVELEKLRTPIMVNAIYVILLALITLSPSMVSSVFGYAVQDQGVLRVLSGTLLGLGVLLWGIAGNVGKYGGLAMYIAIGTGIGALWLLWGWAGHLFTLRNAGVPIVINVVLAAWVWSARTKS